MLKEDVIKSKARKLAVPDANSGAITRISFSIAALIVQFYKYSSSVHDDVSLRVKFLQTDYYQLIKIKCVLSNDSTFDTVFKRTERKMLDVLKHCPNVNTLKIYIQWIVNDEGENATHRCILTPLDRGHRVRFQCLATSFFNTVFRNAEEHYQAIASCVGRDSR